VIRSRRVLAHRACNARYGLRPWPARRACGLCLPRRSGSAGSRLIPAGRTVDEHDSGAYRGARNHLPDAAVCCGKNSALQDGVEAAGSAFPKGCGREDPRKASRAGRTSGHNYGRIHGPDSISPWSDYFSLQSNRALLMLWKSRLYLLYGAGSTKSFITPASGTTSFISSSYWILRFSDSRREVSFNARATIGARCKGCWRYLSWPRSKALLPGFVRGGTHDSQSSNRTRRSRLGSAARCPVSRVFCEKWGF